MSEPTPLISPQRLAELEQQAARITRYPEGTSGRDRTTTIYVNDFAELVTTARHTSDLLDAIAALKKEADRPGTYAQGQRVVLDRLLATDTNSVVGKE